MTNEEFQKLVLKKLEKLDSLEESQKDLQESQDDLIIKVENMDKKIDGVVEQTAHLTEFKNQVRKELEYIKRSVSKIEIIRADNWSDIARLKAAK